MVWVGTVAQGVSKGHTASAPRNSGVEIPVEMKADNFPGGGRRHVEFSELLRMAWNAVVQELPGNR